MTYIQEFDGNVKVDGNIHAENITALESDMAARLATKVDKVAGKVLSTNDFTTAEKQRVAASALTTDMAARLATKVDKVAGKVLSTNDFTTAEKQRVAAAALASDMATGLATKVDKVEGKGLSTNDFTTAEKQRVAASALTTDMAARLATKVDKVEGKVLSTNDFTTEEKQRVAAAALASDVNKLSDILPLRRECNLAGEPMTLDWPGTSLLLTPGLLNNQTIYIVCIADGSLGKAETVYLYDKAIPLQEGKQILKKTNTGAIPIFAGDIYSVHYSEALSKYFVQSVFLRCKTSYKEIMAEEEILSRYGRMDVLELYLKGRFLVLSLGV